MRVDIAGFTRGSKNLDHSTVMDFCVRMDALGYDGIWFNEFHFQQPPDPYPSTLLLAAAILSKTKRIRVGTSICVLPLYHPLLLAEQVAQLHWQSGGRFDFGIGRGTSPDTLCAMGISVDETRDRFTQAFELIQSAWHGPTHVPEGSLWPASTVPVGPILPKGENVPIYIAGSTPETVGLAIEQGLPLLLSLEPNEQRQLSLVDSLKGKSGGPYQADYSISRYLMTAPTEAEAMAGVDALLPRLYERRLRFAAQQNKLLDGIKPIDRDQFLNEQMIAGDPNHCAEQLIALRDRTGIDSIRLIFNCNGEIPEAQADAMASLFGHEALPALHALPALSPKTEIS